MLNNKHTFCPIATYNHGHWTNSQLLQSKWRFFTVNIDWTHRGGRLWVELQTPTTKSLWPKSHTDRRTDGQTDTYIDKTIYIYIYIYTYIYIYIYIWNNVPSELQMDQYYGFLLVLFFIHTAQQLLVWTQTYAFITKTHTQDGQQI